MPARLKFSVHAQIRLQERNIDVSHIKAALLHPDFTEQANQGKIRCKKLLESGKTIEVIYAKEDFRNTNDYFIVTAYYL